MKNYNNKKAFLYGFINVILMLVYFYINDNYPEIIKSVGETNILIIETIYFLQLFFFVILDSMLYFKKKDK